MDAEVAVHGGAVGSGATGNNAGRKFHGPGDIFFDLVEAAVVVDGRGIGGDICGLLAGEVAARIEAVNADVEDRATTGEFLVQCATPGNFVESEGALDRLHFANERHRE